MAWVSSSMWCWSGGGRHWPSLVGSDLNNWTSFSSAWGPRPPFGDTAMGDAASADCSPGAGGDSASASSRTEEPPADGIRYGVTEASSLP